MFTWSWESPRRGGNAPDRPLGEFHGRQRRMDPSTASHTPRRAAVTFDWFRCRMVGGRTNHWGRISLRYGPDDFNRARA